nr:immunoglobulin heavy chain junction region [Macaca mulatta]MOV47497.1 immunoglobulin heavy chain junction region [Macaca mulatta]MOV47508.1 immunoglobulin heavy chain junction region [Macaca mulatta]MOV47522.1 immunoglobulin heavy chain junction region [Macaca mulatta]MOV47685.1 immunoglobulin heavy chain junction region [Macaca mulatta]
CANAGIAAAGLEYW